MGKARVATSPRAELTSNPVIDVSLPGVLLAGDLGLEQTIALNGRSHHVPPLVRGVRCTIVKPLDNNSLDSYEGITTSTSPKRIYVKLTGYKGDGI